MNIFDCKMFELKIPLVDRTFRVGSDYVIVDCMYIKTERLGNLYNIFTTAMYIYMVKEVVTKLIIAVVYNIK